MHEAFKIFGFELWKLAERERNKILMKFNGGEGHHQIKKLRKVKLRKVSIL